MNGAQDLGGRMGFGTVLPEPNEPVFHAAWEGRALANVIATQALGYWSGDASRFARESLPPADYLSFSYYRIWFTAMEKILIEHGAVSADEIDAGRALHESAIKPEKIFGAAIAGPALARGWPSEREAQAQPRFAIGDAVRVKNLHPAHHTRLPGYARNRAGVVERIRGCHVFPDSNAHKRGPDPQWVYCVRFTAQELWGEDADPLHSVTIDAFEPYLDHA